MIYYYKQSTKETFEDICIDENNKIRELKPKPKPKKRNPKEVFYIESKFNYLEAQEICKLYNGKLATLEQLEEAFNNGANWCSWGWLNNKIIAHPVQEKFWLDMEKIHKGHCGPTAGINKLYNRNPLQKYGVNCYGIKPKPKHNSLNIDNKLIALKGKIKKCKSIKKKVKQEKTKKWLDLHKKDIKILNFNDSTWSYSNPNTKKKTNKTTWF